MKNCGLTYYYSVWLNNVLRESKLGGSRPLRPSCNFYNCDYDWINDQLNHHGIQSVIILTID